MRSPTEDYDLVLEAPNPTEAELAKDLLASRGITCFTLGADRDLAELGAGVHNSLTRPNVYVEKGKGDSARAILDEAWAKEPLAASFDVGERVDETPDPRPASPLSTTALLVVIVLGVVVAVALRLYFTSEPGHG
jgi:hypothetical protein